VAPDLTTDPNYPAMVAYLRAVFPAAQIGIVWMGVVLVADYDYQDTSGGGCGSGWDTLLDNLWWLYHFAWASRPANAFIYCGLLIDNQTLVPVDTSGCGRSGQPIAAGVLNTRSGETIADEMGHNFGRGHAPCGVPDPDEGWPNMTYPEATIGEVGVNVLTGTTYDPAAPGDQGDPTKTWDFMSYCQPEWISPYTWARILTAMPDTAAAMSEAAPSPHIAVSGWVTEEGITLRPFWVLELPAGEHGGQGTGAYGVELQGAGGAVLFLRRFDVPQPSGFPDHSVGDFQELMPFPTGTKRIVFRHGTGTLRVVNVSPNRPGVTVTAPNGGQVWNGPGPYTVTWRMDDADGDPLTAAVLYSTDGGATWQPLAVNVQGRSLTLDATGLPGSDQALIQVRVTDGVNTVSDASDAVFRVARKAPAVFVLAPSDRQVLRPDEALVLSGLATDPEQGSLRGEALSWRSDRDGLLGTGENVAVPSLSRGAQSITLTATGQDGKASSRSVHVFVGYSFHLPLVARAAP